MYNICKESATSDNATSLSVCVKNDSIPTLNCIYIKNGNPKNMVIMLHGYASNKESFSNIAKQINLTDTLFVIPDAPYSCGGNESLNSQANIGFEWFPLPNLDPKIASRHIAKYHNNVHHLINTQCSKHKIKEDRVALVGFSQGGFIGLHAGLQMPKNKTLAGVVTVGSGFLDSIARDKTISKTKISFIHGGEDKVVPTVLSRLSHRHFQKLGIDSDLTIVPNTHHTINSDVAGHISNSLQLMFKDIDDKKRTMKY